MPRRFIMTMNEIKDFLLFCTIVNYVMLLIWAGAFILAHDWMYRLHSRWFKIPLKHSMPFITQAWPYTKLPSSCLTLCR